MKTNRHIPGYFFIALCCVMVMIAGCSKEQAVQPVAQTNINADADAAETIAGALGEYNGGAMDQLSDLCALASPSGFQGLGKSTKAEEARFKDATYDPSTGTWTVVVSRERGSADGEFYAKIERTYAVQFLNKNGEPQQYWIVDEDTAYTITFNVIDASGEHRTPKVSQGLKDLQAALTATGVNTETVTINGTYMRAAANTITTDKFVRTHDHTLDLIFTDIVGPRGSRLDWSQKVSGTITGTYSAEITFTGEQGYGERTIEREINIDLAAGTADIHIGAGRYKGDLYWGRCNGQ